MFENNIGLCFLSQKGYKNVNPPFHPPKSYPELDFLSVDASFANPQNQVYEGVRQLFALLNLDAENFGNSKWNPLRKFLTSGNTVVIKPNLVRHFNPSPNGTLNSVITHGSVLRPIIDYCLKALNFNGRIVIADAPQHDCDMEEVKQFLGFEALKDFYDKHFGFILEFIDLRQEFVKFTNGIITERIQLAADPLGYSAVDLGKDSEFYNQTACDRLRGADYDEKETLIHHSDDRHEYLISNTILSSDLVINVPKIKTHKKAGVTLALKNLVGINGNKNWLPHHRMGFPDEGGDEFPHRSVKNQLRSFAVEKARYFLKRGKFQKLFQIGRKTEKFLGATPTLRSGNWYGNDTIWRTIIDLNKIFFFADKQGNLQNEQYADRRYLVIFDGIVAGEENGPMSPTDKPLGLIYGGFDAVLLDIAIVQLIGFDWMKIPKIYYSTKSKKYRYTTFTNIDDIEVDTFDFNTERRDRQKLSNLLLNFGFKPHHGWKGYIELKNFERD